MKNICALFLLLWWSIALIGQTPDTTFISISQENAPLEKQRLMDSYDQMFSMMEPTRWLFALNFSALSGNGNDLLRASAEVKLLPAISLHGSYGFGYGYSTSDPYTSSIKRAAHRYALQPRWYYAMPRRIRQGKSANNMSGNYIGLEAVYVRNNSNIGNTPVVGDQRSVALRYGVQRRLFRYGFLDIGFGLGMLKEERSAYQTPFKDDWHLFANSQIGLGLALARPKTTASSGGYCDVLRCFREERQMWKIDLYNLIRINSFDDMRGKLSVGYERKLGTSSFSLEVEGAWSKQYSYVVYQEINPLQITTNTTLYDGTLQSRYYYSQKHRIAQGKSGNNLSGVYVGAQFRWLEERNQTEGYQCGTAGCFPNNVQSIYQNVGGGLAWGIQHRLFQHGFIDFQVIGSRVWVQSKHVYGLNDFTNNYSSQQFDLNFKFRAGLAF